MPSEDELDQLRAAMDVCNRRLAAVLHDRARLVRQIAAWKRAHGVPIVDPAREQAMLAALLAAAQGDDYPPAALRTILSAVFAASRSLATDPG